MGRAILRMQFQPGLGCRGQGNGLVELSAIRGMGRMAEWKTHLGIDHYQGLCGGCVYALPRGTCLRGWEVSSPALTLCTRLSTCRAVTAMGMGSSFWFAQWYPIAHSSPTLTHSQSCQPALCQHKEPVITRGGREESWRGSIDPFLSKCSSNVTIKQNI